MTTPNVRAVAGAAARLFGGARFDGYLSHCNGDKLAALALYQWNAAASAAFWEAIGHLEIALRNAVADAMTSRHARLGRAGSWLDDAAGDLAAPALVDIDRARRRVSGKGHPASDGQTIAELGFGFWRFLLARRYTTTLWPDLARAFPHAPNRRRQTVELPVVQLHDLRNRLAHHERIWNQPLTARYHDALDVLDYIAPELAQWISDHSRVPALLAACPQPRPYP